LVADVGHTPVLAVDALAFRQTFSLSVDTASGGGLSVGRPSVSELSVTVPLSAQVLRFLEPLNAGETVASLSLEMCRSDEATGDCVLQLDLTHAFLTGMHYGDSPVDAEATADLTFAPTTEEVTGRSGTAARSVSYDVTDNTATPAGSVPPESASPFLTTLTGSPGVLLGTDSWKHAITNVGSPLSGGGAGAGKAVHDPITAVTHTGPGTAELLYRLLRGTHTQTATITGCPATSCVQSVTLADVLITHVVLGSPNLTDKADLTYGSIEWDRFQSPTRTRFGWDVAANRAL
jgi:type VI protein secretion system component Hcp